MKINIYIMRKLKYILMLSFTISMAQIQTPQPSPFAKIEQIVGLTQVSLEYSRPSMRGRIIMGDLVPFGELWRTGANKNSTIQFSDDVKLGGKSAPKGKYAIYIRPGEAMWEVFFYNKSDNWGLPKNWDLKSIITVIEVPVKELQNPIESFTISLDDINNNGASISIKWEKTQVKIPLEVPTDQKTMASIESTLKTNPKAGDYYSAALYYKDSGKDLKVAKRWIEKSLLMEEGKYYMYRQQSLILAGLNEKDEAIKAANTSLKLAKKAGNNDYVRLNTKSIEEWSK